MKKWIIFLTLLTPILAQSNTSFENWKKKFIERASKRGLPKKFLRDVLRNTKLDPSVIKKDQKQVLKNSSLDYNKFIQRWLRQNSARVTEGKKLIKKHHSLLQKVEDKYGVDKEVIVALWGTETFYGKIMGKHDLITSLASLSFEGRRRKFFETQLKSALRFIYQGHITRDKLIGSWAGATGQCQFMPSNLPVYAQDFDGDGKKDIWNSLPDVFASIAYYLKKVGWKKGKSIGSLALNNKKKDLNNFKYRSIASYNQLGFTNLDGSKINGNWRGRKIASIPLDNSPYILQGSNFKPLMYWNKSTLFAAFNIILMEEFK